MTQATPQGPATPKKGLPALAWVAIGCGGLLVLGLAAFLAVSWFAVGKVKQLASEAEKNPAKVAAEMMVRFNPELEMVSSDDDAGTMTVRNKKTGEEVTLDFEDIQQGHFGFKTDEGEVSFDASGNEEGGTMTVTTKDGVAKLGAGAGAAKIPRWIPLYPGASEPQATYTASTGEEESGIFTLTTSDAVSDVLDFYHQRLQSAGYEVRVQTFDLGGGAGSQGMVIGESKDPARTLTVTATHGEEEGTQVMLQYSGKP